MNDFQHLLKVILENECEKNQTQNKVKNIQIHITESIQ